MTELEHLTNCIEQELSEFERQFDTVFESEKTLLKEIINYWFAKKGKRIRPIITILVANALGKATDKTLRAAAVVELIHTASLIHDDVLDESGKRRGRQTINNLWGNSTAILLGDYLYGKCMAFIVTQEDFNLMPVYSHIATSLPKGELLQKSLYESGLTTEEDYFEVIYNKTASLLEASCELGARTSNNLTLLSSLKEAGRNMGFAFQIKDDIFDFSLENINEKPIGNDIREKKITLPMIYYLQEVNDNSRKNIVNFIASDNKRDEGILHIIECVRDSGCLQKAQQKVEYFSKKAEETILMMPDNVYRTALLNLIKFLINRTI
jgi:octaprenyl-diphosphate synthase